jgi:hypothetical protein
MSESTDDIIIEGWSTEKIKMECTPTAPCGRLTCAACSDPYRSRWIRKTHDIAESHPGEHEIATFDLGAIPAGFLAAVNFRVPHDLLRQAVGLAGFQGLLLRGAIDVNWESAQKEWIVLAHALAIGVPPDVWAKYRALPKSRPSYFGPKFRLKVQPLRDPERQIPELLKLHTYFWPRSGTGAARSLPAKRLEELTDWGSYRTLKRCTFQFWTKG